MKLTPTFEPHTAGFLYDRREGIAVGDLSVLGEEHHDVPGTGVAPGLSGVARHRVGTAGVGDVEDDGVRAAGRVDEGFVDLWSHRATAHDYDGAPGWADLDWAVGHGPGLERGGRWRGLGDERGRKRED